MGCGILYRMVAERIGLGATLATRRTVREKLRNIHWECVMWRIFEINCLAQLAPLMKLLDIAKWKFCIS